MSPLLYHGGGADYFFRFRFFSGFGEEAIHPGSGEEDGFGG